MKSFAKIAKIARIFGWTLFCVLILMFVMLNSKTFQNSILKTYVNSLSKDLGVPVDFRDFSFEFPLKIKLKGFFVADQKADTLFYIDEVVINLKQLKRDRRFAGLAPAKLSGALINFGIHKDENEGNYEFFINHFSPPRDTTKPKVIWTILFEQITLSDCEFRYFNKNVEKPDNMDFNPSDMRFQNISGELKNFALVDDSISFYSKNLSTTEHSGLQVKHMQAFTRIHSKGISFHKLKLQTENSSIGDKLVFKYDSWKTMSDFIHSVQMEAVLTNSFLSFKDLLPFGEALQPYAHNVLKIEGEVSGTIDRLRSRNVYVNSQNNTILTGRFDMTGLPDIQSTYLKFDIENFKTTGKELFAIIDLPAPKELDNLGVITYKGKLNGFYNNLVTYGSIETMLGNLNTDVNLNFSEGLDKAKYSGRVRTSSFDLGRLMQEKTLGLVAGDIAIKNGLGLHAEKFSMEVDGSVASMDFYGYNYKNAKLNGDLTHDFFDGKIELNDPALDLDFVGKVNRRKNEEHASFTANISHADLKKLGWDKESSSFFGKIAMNMRGNSLDNVSGTLSFEDVNIYRNEDKVSFDSLNVESYFENGYRSVELTSDFADISLKGSYSLSNLPTALTKFAAELLPGLVEQPSKSILDVDFSYKVTIKNPNEILALFTHDILLSTGHIEGGFNTATQNLILNSEIQKLQITNSSFKNVSLNILKQDKNSGLDLILKTTWATEQNKIKADEIYVTGQLNKNELNYNIVANDNTQSIKLNTSGIFSFYKGQEASIDLEKIDISAKDKNWKLKKPARILLGSDFELSPLELFSEQQSISLALRTKNNNESYLLKLQNFEVGNVNDFLPENMPSFFGVANGGAEFSFSQKQINFLSDLSILQFALNKDTIGNIQINSQRQSGFQNEINASIVSGIFNGVKLNGTMGSEQNPNALNLSLEMPNSEIAVFNQFIPGVSKLKGNARGLINISGAFKEPEFKGFIDLQDVVFVIDYLKVPYILNSKVAINSNSFILSKDTRVTDDKEKSMSVSGSLTHEKFKDWKYDVKLSQMQDFHILSTQKKDNSLFYGEAYADGQARLFGTFESFNMTLNAKTKNGTKISMPVGESEASGPAPYIRFKTHKAIVAEQSAAASIINSLMLEIEVTPVAEIQLIFDEQTGDIIKGSGSGRLLMELDPEGEFVMRGGIRIEKGEYQFVAFNNLVNKKFFLERGGTIMWDGDPLQARIDLTTYNIQMASPNPLLGQSATNTTNTQQRLNTVQARSEIMLKGNLFRPEITFGFDIQNLMEVGMSNLSGVVQRIKNDPDEVNRQVFSLMVFGSFVVPSFISVQAQSGGQGSPLSTGLADLISNQVDAWLSQIDPKWLVDFNLTSNTPDQRSDMIFRLGRKFANERIIIDVTYGTNQAGPANNSFNMEYLATRDGRFRLKAFSRTAAIYNNANAIAPVNTIGIGVFYRKEFNKLFPKSLKDKPETTIDTVVRIADTLNLTHVVIPYSDPKANSNHPLGDSQDTSMHLTACFFEE